jgi:hypothetical protein
MAGPINQGTTMTGQIKVTYLAERILDDLRMIPRAYALLDRIVANAEAVDAAGDTLPAGLSGAWRRLMHAAIAFCERLAARHDGVVIEEDFAGLDLCNITFDDADIAALKLFASDPQYAATAPEALDIIRQCRHIQALLYAEDLRVAA